ncbi:MAG TPA: LAGLIDADG family homing endonuclease [Nitrososphaerales archaeon]|nr:LAGLIDADG family homing endonuclease [Nitrososphaerales archaeon]
MEDGVSSPLDPKKTETSPHEPRKFPRLDTRLLVHEEVLSLRKRSYTYGQIAEEIEREYNVKLCKATISSWVRRLNSPVRAGHMFVPKPSPELAYVIGVETGDAFLNVKWKTYQYRIRLRAVDREFVEAFNQAVSKVLGCAPHKLWKGKTERETHVEFGSYLLHKFLLQNLQKLKPFIEYDKNCVAAFAKGFFDSEECIERSGRLTATNTDVELLQYVRHLMKKFFGIESTGTHLGTKKGSILTRRGRSYVRNSDCFLIYIRRASVGIFHREIGMTILRKADRLEKFLALQESRSSKKWVGVK